MGGDFLPRHTTKALRIAAGYPLSSPENKLLFDLKDNVSCLYLIIHMSYC